MFAAAGPSNGVEDSVREFEEDSRMELLRVELERLESIGTSLRKWLPLLCMGQVET